MISEDYSYKTEPYYTILHHELDGKIVSPTSSAVLDAFVVPICLERPKSAGIPVCEWGISQGMSRSLDPVRPELFCHTSD